jgi:hypothetical protein
LAGPSVQDWRKDRTRLGGETQTFRLPRREDVLVGIGHAGRIMILRGAGKSLLWSVQYRLAVISAEIVPA